MLPPPPPPPPPPRIVVCGGPSAFRLQPPATACCAHCGSPLGGGGTTAHHIAAGLSCGFIVCRCGTLHGFGTPFHGELPGEWPPGSHVPVLPFLAWKVSRVACGEHHVLAGIVAHGQAGGAAVVVSWGCDVDGQLGQSHPAGSLARAPGRVPGLPAGRVVGLAAGRSHSLAVLLTAGSTSVVSWGANVSGQTGSTDAPSASEPPRRVLMMTTAGAASAASRSAAPVVVAAAAGQLHSALVDAAGLLWTCGSGVQLQLGHPQPDDLARPSVVAALEGLRLVAVSCGAHHTAALSDTGDVYVCGSLCDTRGVGGSVANLPRVVCAPPRPAPPLFLRGHDGDEEEVPATAIASTAQTVFVLGRGGHVFTIRAAASMTLSPSAQLCTTAVPELAGRPSCTSIAGGVFHAMCILMTSQQTADPTMLC